MTVNEAPAIQLIEHARAIIADDVANGFQRVDPLLHKLAKGSSNAVSRFQFSCAKRFSFLLRPVS